MKTDVAPDKIQLQSDELIPPLSNIVPVDNSVAIEPPFEMQPISKFGNQRAGAGIVTRLAWYNKPCLQEINDPRDNINDQLPLEGNLHC